MHAPSPRATAMRYGPSHPAYVPPRSSQPPTGATRVHAGASFMGRSSHTAAAPLLAAARHAAPVTLGHAVREPFRGERPRDLHAVQLDLRDGGSRHAFALGVSHREDAP